MSHRCWWEMIWFNLIKVQMQQVAATVSHHCLQLCVCVLSQSSTAERVSPSCNSCSGKHDYDCDLSWERAIAPLASASVGGQISAGHTTVSSKTLGRGWRGRGMKDAVPSRISSYLALHTLSQHDRQIKCRGADTRWIPAFVLLYQAHVNREMPKLVWP